MFEVAWYMRSMEQLLLDFADGSDFAAVAARPDHRAARGAGRAASPSSGADVICLGDDVGTQRGMLMSVRMWRAWLKPRLARVIAAARRARPDVLVFYHSDGNVAAIVPDLVEIGVDILNPVQPECMDPVALTAAVRRPAVALGHHRHSVHLPVRHRRTTCGARFGRASTRSAATAGCSWRPPT